MGPLSLGQILKKLWRFTLSLRKMYRKSLKRLSSKFWNGPPLCVALYWANTRIRLLRLRNMRLPTTLLKNISKLTILCSMKQGKTGLSKTKRCKCRITTMNGQCFRIKRLWVWFRAQRLYSMSWSTSCIKNYFSIQQASLDRRLENFNKFLPAHRYPNSNYADLYCSFYGWDYPFHISSGAIVSIRQNNCIHIITLSNQGTWSFIPWLSLDMTCRVIWLIQLFYQRQRVLTFSLLVTKLLH